MGNNPELKVFQRVSASRKDIPFDVHPEGKDKIDDERRSHREKRDVDEPGPDPGSGNAHSFPDGSTHPKHLPFDKVLQSVHTSNL
jgi:hypothetical protein